jgi:hypothetical protein
MTTRDGDDAPIRPRPPTRTLDAVCVAIEHNATADVTADFEAALGRAWRRATDTANLQPLHDLVEGWWPTAASWATDPEGTRRVNAGIEWVMRDEPPPPEWRLARDEIRARYGV